jgi:RimJ/RimL family protein N-acetyltransferase
LEHKKNALKIKHIVKSKEFEKFLISLSKKTLQNFNPFGKITKKNIKKIVLSESRREDKINFFSSFENELIGYSFLTKFEKPTKKHNCILGMVITDKWQKKGFGQKICLHMIKYAWQKKYDKIWLTVFSDNLDGVKLYQKCGFEIEGIFIDDEKSLRSKRNVVSMAIFKNSKDSVKKRNGIMKKLSLK